MKIFQSDKFINCLLINFLLILCFNHFVKSFTLIDKIDEIIKENPIKKSNPFWPYAIAAKQILNDPNLMALTSSSSILPNQSDTNNDLDGDDDNDANNNNELTQQDVEEGRRKGKGKKNLRRYMYPVLIGLFIAKVIIFPLLLKALTIMSSASFVISKMSLLTSVLLGFKWFLTNQPMQPMAMVRPESPKVEIVHIPAMKKQQQHEWDRETDNKYHSPVMNENYDNYYTSDVELKPTTYI